MNKIELYNRIKGINKIHLKFDPFHARAKIFAILLEYTNDIEIVLEVKKCWRACNNKQRRQL